MNGLVTGGVKGLQRDISQNWVAFNFFLTRDCGWGARHCLGWAGPEGSWRQELSASHGHAEPQTGWPVRCRQRAGNGTRELTCLLPAIKQQSHTSWHGDTDNKAGRDTPDRSASSLHRCRAVPTDRQTDRFPGSCNPSVSWGQFTLLVGALLFSGRSLCTAACSSPSWRDHRASTQDQDIWVLFLALLLAIHHISPFPHLLSGNNAVLLKPST